MVSSSLKILHAALVINVALLVSGLTVCSINLDQYSWGLYLVLVAIVGLIICIAFCLLGPEDQPEPLAKKMWSRMTVRSSTVKASPKRRLDAQDNVLNHHHNHSQHLTVVTEDVRGVEELSSSNQGSQRQLNEPLNANHTCI